MTYKFKINNLVLQNSKYEDVKKIIENQKITEDETNKNKKEIIENKKITEDEQTKFILSKEYFNNIKNEYPYNYFIVSSFEEVETLLKTNNNFYEILQYNKPLKPFFDVDFNLDEHKINVKTDKNKILTNIKDEIKQFFLDCFKINIDEKEIIILDGERNNKLSWHIIINNNYYFKNITQHKEFIKYIQSKEIILKSFEIPFNTILDGSIYTKNRNFRCVNQSKLKYNEKPFIMTSKHNIKDSLIIDYFNKCNTKNILNCSFIAKLNKDKNYNDAIYYNIDKNELNIILSYIPKKYFKDYESWHKIAAAIKNINYDFYDLLNNYSKGQKKYNETQNKYIYDNELDNLNFSWGFLTSLITDEKLNNLIKNLLIKDYKTFDSPKIPDDIKIINDENRYINHELLINSTEKHIILWALMDKGKTHATEQLYTHLINIKNSSESITRKNIDNIINDKQNQRREFISKNRDFINYIENLNHLENKLNELKKDNQQYNEYEEKINKYKESYTNYRIINENYDTEIYELFKQKDQLFLKNYNPKKKELKVLILTSRITFSKHMSNKFNIINYLDLNDKKINKKEGDKDNNLKNQDEKENNIKNHDASIIISVESLYKLNDNLKFDFIILDEIESLLNQFSSTTCKNKNDCYKKLLYFIKTSNKIIYADAFISARTFNFLNNFNESKLLIINNKYENHRKALIYNDQELLINKMLDDLKTGKKIYAHFTSKNLGEEVQNRILEQKILKQDEIIFYSSIESKKEGMEISNNDMLLKLNLHWSKLKYISSTSSITVGNSYENKDVDDVYIFGGCSHLGGCCVRDSFQNHMRIRNNQGNLFCFIPDEQQKFKPELLNLNEYNKNKDDFLNDLQKNNYFLQNLEEDDIYFLLKNEEIEDNNLKIFLYNSIKYECIENIKNNMQNKYDSKQKTIIMKKYLKVNQNYNNFVKSFNESLNETIKINTFEKYINVNLYYFIFIEYLNKMSYKIEYVKTEKHKKIKIEKIITDYNNINVIEDDLLKEYIENQQKGIMTKKMSNEKNKAFFIKFFENKDDERLEHIYNNIYVVSKEKENYFNNIRLEYNFYNNNNKFKSNLNNHFEKIKNDQTERSVIYNKLFEILEINNIFNIKGSYNENILDATNLIKIFQKYILKPNKIKTIKYLFGVDYNIKLKDDLKHNRTTISKIYNAFNGTTIINNEEKRTCKERIIINYKTENIFNKHINEMENFNLINLFKIYKDVNEFEADFID